MLRIAVADDEFYARKGLIRKIHIAEADLRFYADKLICLGLLAKLKRLLM